MSHDLLNASGSKGLLSLVSYIIITAIIIVIITIITIIIITIFIIISIINSTIIITITITATMSPVQKLVSLNSWEELRQCSSSPTFQSGGYSYWLPNISLQVNW